MNDVVHFGVSVLVVDVLFVVVLFVVVGEWCTVDQLSLAVVVLFYLSALCSAFPTIHYPNTYHHSFSATFSSVQPIIF